MTPYNAQSPSQAPLSSYQSRYQPLPWPPYGEVRRAGGYDGDGPTYDNSKVTLVTIKITRRLTYWNRPSHSRPG
jgi:hypothetical protein